MEKPPLSGTIWILRQQSMEQFPLHTIGRILIIVGGLIVVIGVIILLGGKIPLLGKLPGDIHIKGKNFSFHFPLVTSILLSIILTIIVNLIFRK